eukprot:2660656-Amphidinium_carterae.3
MLSYFSQHVKVLVAYRTIVGKLLCMWPLRPDIQYATKELTRAVQKPNQYDKFAKQAPNFLRYLQGTRNCILHLRRNNQHTTSLTSKPTATATEQAVPQQEKQQ